LTEAEFTRFFDVTETDVDGDGTLDTRLSLGDGSMWQVDLLAVSGQSIEDLYDNIAWL